MAMKTPAYVGAVVGVIALIIVGVPTLVGWQWVEGRRLRRTASP